MVWSRKSRSRPAEIVSLLIGSAKILEHERSKTFSAFVAAARQLVTRLTLTYLVDEFFFLFLVQLNEKRTLGESRVLSFSFFC